MTRTIINNPHNTPLINFLVGKLPTISNTIIGANETGNDTAYLKKLFAYIKIHSQPHLHSHRIPHSPKSSSSNLPKPLSITYLDHHSKNSVISSLHLLKKSSFQVRFCEPLNNSQLARKDCISTIHHSNSSHPIPNFNYVIKVPRHQQFSYRLNCMCPIRYCDPLNPLLIPLPLIPPRPTHPSPTNLPHFPSLTISPSHPYN